ncbi:unnamed protein product [Blepharisma stoltei]|uniref:Uncharacterized protein n=1 Tax=Blepharisma stoltei TaxID=1481888 RepID=A0AAU9K126_9CILI|nr:unnamed protein product [Blepharisma stoltei]
MIKSCLNSSVGKMLKVASTNQWSASLSKESCHSVAHMINFGFPLGVDTIPDDLKKLIFKDSICANCWHALSQSFNPINCLEFFISIFNWFFIIFAWCAILKWI